MKRRTLRFRLTAGIVALLTVAAVTIGLVTVLGLHRFLIEQLDGQLQAAGTRTENVYGLRDDDDRAESGEDGKAELGEVPGLPAGALITRLRDDSSQAYLIAAGPQQLAAEDLAALEQLPLDGTPHTVRLSFGSFRSAALTERADDVLVVGLPMRELVETMARLAAIEVGLFVLVIGVSGLIAARFVGTELQPLRRVAGTAKGVAALQLGTGQVKMPDRAPTDDPDTEVGQVGAALNLLLDNVETSLTQRHATEERLRRFVADASHELRTPVSVISGYMQLAQRHASDVPPQVATSLDHIRAETDRMTALVDDLLLLARLDSGRPLAREPVDLSRLAIDVVNGARVAAPGHRWQLQLPEEPVVIAGDEQRLRQVLANVATNARSHTPKGTSVSVVLHYAEPGWVRLEVVDDGPGIPAELQPELFERFVRGAASRSRASGTSGLGLAIVEAVITAHTGTVTVDSVPGRTRFTIRLPADGPRAARANGA